MLSRTEIAQEQLCDSRERHNVDFTDLQESASKGKDEGEGVQKKPMRKSTTTGSVVASYQRYLRVGEILRDTAGATHSVSCGTTDRDRNEATYLQESLDLPESFHRHDIIQQGLNALLLPAAERRRCCVMRMRRCRRAMAVRCFVAVNLHLR